MGRKTEQTMRTYHRYLGFFLAGIMAMYAISGIVLIFRNTDYLKKDIQIEKKLETHLTAQNLGKALKKKKLKVNKEEGGIIYFETGTYNTTTGEAQYLEKRLPLVLDKMAKIHKANSDHPLFFLNIFFGVSLLFFVLSAFWMFRPNTPIFKKGLYFTFGGVILTLILLFV
ncbi:hypothetical protein [Ulvibacterium marinum]|uniref:PepSY domain-containing protein n=1 Tax=Ulvibacterium marinum TaxID=2419782 RepID=A0A3B0CAI5_9FLAO|nr:hypothetical protein [Ulvibacterium marinum]RKN79836.1 hypothetical protein D7Z94_16310 [Ulvibacterium marinum]